MSSQVPSSVNQHQPSDSLGAGNTPPVSITYPAPSSQPYQSHSLGPSNLPSHSHSHSHSLSVDSRSQPNSQSHSQVHSQSPSPSSSPTSSTLISQLVSTDLSSVHSASSLPLAPIHINQNGPLTISALHAILQQQQQQLAAPQGFPVSPFPLPPSLSGPVPPQLLHLYPNLLQAALNSAPQARAPSSAPSHSPDDRAPSSDLVSPMFRFTSAERLNTADKAKPNPTTKEQTNNEKTDSKKRGKPITDSC